MRSLTIPVLLGAMMLVSSGSAAAFEVFPGDKAYTVGLSQEDLVLHRMSDEFYTESWYFMARLDDGRQIFFHYGFSNAGFGSFTGAIEATVIDPDGEVHFEKTQVDSDDVSYEEDRLAIDFDDGRFTLTGEPGQYRFTGKGEEIAFDLEVSAVAPGVKLGDGKTYFGDDRSQFYALAILTSKGRISGELTVDGEASTVEGFAYGDHSWQNYPAHKMADRLYSMRGFSEDDSVAFLVFAHPDGGLIPALVVTKGEEVVLATHELKLKETEHETDPEKTEYQVPQKILLRSDAEGATFRGIIELGDRIQRQDAVSEFSFVERTLIKMFVAQPILYRYENDYRLEIKADDGSVAAVEGDGVVEAMILRAD